MPKISAYTALSSLADTDKFVVVDESDTTMASTGTNKKIPASDVVASIVAFASFLTAVAEASRDAVGTALTAGTGVTITPSDGADTITISLHADLVDLITAWAAASASGPGTLALYEDTDNGTNKVTLSAPSSIASDVTVTVPAVAATVIVGATDGPDNSGLSIGNIGAIESNVNTVAATGATETLDTSLYAVHDCTMDAGCTFTFSNPAASGKNTTFTLILRGAQTPVFPASVDWGDASAPTYTTPSIYVFTTIDAGTTWLGAQVGKAFG